MDVVQVIHRINLRYITARILERFGAKIRGNKD